MILDYLKTKNNRQSLADAGHVNWFSFAIISVCTLLIIIELVFLVKIKYCPYYNDPNLTRILAKWIKSAYSFFK